MTETPAAVPNQAGAGSADIYTSHSAEELPEVLAAQRADFLREGVPTAAVRRDRIDRLVALLTENIDEFSAALEADFGARPDIVNQLSEAAGILPDIASVRAGLEKWMAPTRIRANTLAALPTVVEKRPLGVVGIIGPWNFPISLVVQPAAAAFAGGNRVMIKFSDVTARTAEAFARRSAEYFRPDELAVVTGGVEIGVAFSKLRFDHIFFTGSPGVGSIIAQEAAKNLVPVTLELGGKNPAVVSRDADLATAASRIMAARLANGGQICLCPDEAFVPADRIDEFVQLALAESARIAPTLTGNTDLVSIVNTRNFDRVVGLIDDAVAKGATAHTVDRAGEVLPDRATRRIAPTLLTGVTDAMDIARDEVFGPVLTVRPYAGVTEVVTRLAEQPTPLAAYWYGPTGDDFDVFRERTASGGMTVNDFAVHCAVPGVPFGGVGRSGSGAYHGKAGFDTFTHERAVVTSRLPISFGRMITPPYSPAMAKIVSTYVKAAGKKARRRIGASGTNVRR
ncbi:aldehyde dehydrogenase family protein [Gordonia terrae]